MNEPKRQLVQAWLTKARRDLTSAHVLAAQVEPLLDTAVYHCQQAGEKAVKAFLTFHDCEFERIHDVERLVRLAIPFESRFAVLVSDARLLTPYATFFRYPGVTAEPTESEFARAIMAANNIYEFVLTMLPAQALPEI
jgi:HEPN domain-containing protein